MNAVAPVAHPEARPDPSTDTTTAESKVERARRSYGEILSSSIIIGSSSVINVIVAVARAKAIALLVGPAGIGLMGLYISILNLSHSVAGMGLNGSGVRQIAAAVGTGDDERVGKTTAVLRRAALFLGATGALLVAALSVPIAELTFGSADHSPWVALLAVAVFFRVLADGQGALLQGLRRIPDVARVAVFGGVVGTGGAIVAIAALGMSGIVPALVAMTAGTLWFSWTYSRRARPATPATTVREVTSEAGALLKLGFAFMASGILMMGSAYAVRLIVAREADIAAAGLYHAAWTVGGFYVGFILQAMGTDFYPRLVGVIQNHAEANRLVNEQAHVSMLLAGPGIIGTIAFAPIVVSVFYSSEFAGAAEMLRWMCLGATMQVLTWPLGFIVVAQGRQLVFLLCEVAYCLVHVGLAWHLVERVGSSGAAVAFFGSYVFHGILLYPVVRRLTGFRWSAPNARLAALYVVLIALTFAGFVTLPNVASYPLGITALISSCWYSFRAVKRLSRGEGLPDRLRHRSSSSQP